MKKVFFLCVVFQLMLTTIVMAQDERTQEEKKEPPKEEPKDEAFGDYIKNVGLSIWKRVKERLNLDETLQNLEEQKEKILGDKGKKEDKSVSPLQPKPKVKDEDSSP